jgi:hypothetical protein
MRYVIPYKEKGIKAPYNIVYLQRPDIDVNEGQMSYIIKI